MSLTARGEDAALLGGGAWPAAREAATGSKPRAQLAQRLQLRGPVVAVEAPADQPGVEDVPALDRSSTVTPTRRREVTIPIDSRTRTTSRATDTETAYSRDEPLQGQHGARAELARDDPAADVVEGAAVQLT